MEVWQLLLVALGQCLLLEVGWCYNFASRPISIELQCSI